MNFFSCSKSGGVGNGDKTQGFSNEGLGHVGCAGKCGATRGGQPQAHDVGSRLTGGQEKQSGRVGPSARRPPWPHGKGSARDRAVSSVRGVEEGDCLPLAEEEI